MLGHPQPAHPETSKQVAPQAAVRMGQGHLVSKTSETFQELWDECLVFNPSTMYQAVL